MASSRLSLFLFVLVHALLFVSTPVSCNGGIALFLSYILIYNLFNYLLQINDQTRAASIVGTLRISCLLHLTQTLKVDQLAMNGGMNALIIIHTMLITIKY